MNDTQKKVLLEMIGTDGLEKLIDISSLFPKDYSYAEPFLLACHFLNVQIRKYYGIIEQEAARENEEENHT